MAWFKHLFKRLSVSKFFAKIKRTQLKPSRSLSQFVSAGNRFNAEKKWQAAILQYEQALQYSPDLADIWVQLGHCQKEMRDFQNAEISYRRAAGLGSADAYFHLGHLLNAPDQLFARFDAFLRSYTLDPHGPAKADLESITGTTQDFGETLVGVRAELDIDFYVKTYADVRLAGIDPFAHYMLYGWKENRFPSALFDAEFYVRRYRKELRRGVLPVVHFAQHGRALNYRSNPVGRKTWYEPIAPSQEEWDKVPAALLNEKTRAIVVLPVYKGYDETLASVYFALKSRHGEKYSLLVVNDHGPDEALNAQLRMLADRQLFDYYESDVNRGFVQTVNLAISQLTRDLDVILLNSDAYVFPGWFGRLVAHADKDPKVATITPLSNNATICSYPFYDRDNYISLELEPAKMDGLAAEINQGLSVETPTGVGFCFYMRRAVIDAVGALDAVAFKVGYGEENDFCMRALNAGYKNLIACDVFVFHVGAVSFSASKDANFKAGQKALNAKHPNYTQLVGSHVLADPGRYGRRRLDVARLAANAAGCEVIITHAWSGGIETYISEIAGDLDSRSIPYFVLRVHDGNSVSIETSLLTGIYAPNLSGIDLRTEQDFVELLLTACKPSRIHVNSFAGLDWPNHKRMLEIIRTSGADFSYVVHDYSAISHAYQLIRPDGMYVGVPDMATRRAWSRMRNQSVADVCDPHERKQAYEAFLEAATSVLAPSNTARNIFQSEFPNIDVTVVPHKELPIDMPAAQRRTPDGRIKIATIGAIGQHKGSDVILGLAKDALERKLPINYSIVGYSNIDDAMREGGVEITGKYASDEEAACYLSEIEPDFILIPSIWPETYCYTLSFALKLGIPVIVFDLGAQAERVVEIPWAYRIETKYIVDPKGLSNEILKINVDEAWRHRNSSESFQSIVI
jgi:GT2 family glycosyltransferase/glycosyltransferase involved in cell wall biosynthesis